MTSPPNGALRIAQTAPLTIALTISLGCALSAHGQALSPTQGASTPSPAPTAPTAPTVSSAPSVPTADAAVSLALRHSPALQALEAQAQADAALARADARPGLFGLSFSRLRQGDETEIERHLSLGLLDLLVWPLRSAAADRRIDLLQQQRAQAVLNHAHAVRRQWVLAVAAQARSRFQADSLAAAQTAAELARRLHGTGQFSAAQRDVRVAQAAEAQLTAATTAQQARREREALIRLLGLQGEPARALTLPTQLPLLPTQPSWRAEAVQQAASQRLDVRLAEARWRALQADRGVAWARSLVDIEAGWARTTSNDGPVQQGPSMDVRLIAIDLGAARREARNQQELAALAGWQQTALAAESLLRERWADLQDTHATAKAAAEVLMALRQHLLDERLKQYNGMLIGPLELLDEARSHRDTVLTVQDALRDHWLADAALQAAIEGADSAMLATPAAPRTTVSAPRGDGH